MNNVLEQIMGSEESAPRDLKNEQLAEISLLAARQLEIMGYNEDGVLITSPISNDAVEKLVEWGKKAKVSVSPHLQLTLTQCSISELVSALMVQLGQYRNISQILLPEAMSSLEMTEFKLTTGFKVSIRDEVSASIKADRTEQAADFLDSIGCGDVVKDEVKVNMGKGERDHAAAFLELARQKGLAATEKLSVHPATLKSLVKEQLALGVEFPETDFSVFPYKRAEIKPAKK